MILQSLHRLYDRLAEDPAYEMAGHGFSAQKILFKVVLHPDGKLFTMDDMRVRNGNNQLVTTLMEVPGEAKPSGAGINPCFLWDNQTYLLGRQPDGKADGFGARRFEAFRERHCSIEAAINHPDFSAVCRFLAAWTPAQIQAHPILDEIGPGFGVFQILGKPGSVMEEPGIRKWWRHNQSNQGDGPLGQCLLSGEIAPIARLHSKIKGVSGAQASGASMVSFNDRAYESYGRTQSFNSPVGEAAAFRYGTALNTLLGGPQSGKHRMGIGDATCVFWTDRDTLLEDSFTAFAQVGASHGDNTSPDPGTQGKLDTFQRALHQGRKAYADLAADPEHTRFYFLGLAPNAARLSVRFFCQGTVSGLLDHLRQHQQDIAVVRQFEIQVGKRRPDSVFPAFWELLRETARRGDHPSPQLGGALMRSIMDGNPYPEALLTSLIRRVMTDREINYLRAAAIKAVLIRNHHLAITSMLDTTSTDSAYLHGRLFAVLEKIQKESHFERTGKRLERTIRETYFPGACARPAATFPRIEQLSVIHRRHLRPGRKLQIDQILGEIKRSHNPGNVANPSHTLKQQGVFILGYYHQRKALFTITREKTTAAAVA